MEPTILKEIKDLNHVHIDNGGISIDIITKFLTNGDESNYWPEIKILADCQYFGYPSISVSIPVADPKHLKELIDTLSKHYHKITAWEESRN